MSFTFLKYPPPPKKKYITNTIILLNNVAWVLLCVTKEDCVLLRFFVFFVFLHESVEKKRCF